MNGREFQKMGKNGCGVKGSYTVEAAILFPMIVVLIIHLIYAGWWMHNESVLYAASVLAADYAVEKIEAGENHTEQMILEYADSLIQGRLLGVVSVNVQTDYSLWEGVTVSYFGELTYPLGELGALFGTEKFRNIEATCTKQVLYPCRQLKVYQMIKGGYDAGKL